MAKTKKAVFLATLMFASANVFAMNSQSHVGEAQERSQKAEPASDQHKKLMQKEFAELMSAVGKNDLKSVKKIIGDHINGYAVLDLVIAHKNNKKTQEKMPHDQFARHHKGIFRNPHITELVNLFDGFGNTPLYEATEDGHENIVKYLVEHGADVNKTNNGEKPHCM